MKPKTPLQSYFEPNKIFTRIELKNKNPLMPIRTSILKLPSAGKQLVKERPTANQRGYNYKWSKARDSFLREEGNQLCACAECAERLIALPANVVDHKIPHKGNNRLFWDRSNWQPMNQVCHNKKTAREDGGFGR